MATAPDTRKPPNPHGVTLGFGKHKGELITRAPASYLKWMVNTQTPQADVAAAELKRRGHVEPAIEISGHAIDRASLKCRKTWHQTRREGEGIHAWLVRVAQEALASVSVDKAGRYHHLGMMMVFEQDGRWPVLKTILPERHKERPAAVVEEAGDED